MKQKIESTWLSQAFLWYTRSAMLVIVAIGLSTSMLHHFSVNAASNRAKTAAGVIVGAGVGGGIAGGIGGAKWLPLGFGLGGLAGGLVVHAIRKNREKSNGFKSRPRYNHSRRYRNKIYHQEAMQTSPYSSYQYENEKKEIIE